jgi:putative SOS response-associated peptidase YedK
MCYSAMVEQDLKSLARRLGAKPDLAAFAELFGRRLTDKTIRIPKALEANFADPVTPEEARITSAIDAFIVQRTTELESELRAQRQRLANAERAQAVKETKKSAEDIRISTNKIAWCQSKLQALASRTVTPNDSRIFPMWYAPVVVMDQGMRLIRPMRYHCRPDGAPESYDKKFDGLYNARRESLEKFWKGLFGRRHGIMVATSFYENVALHDFEKRPLRPDEKPSNLVLHFNPNQSEPMLVACLWDEWHSPGQPALLSFAAITDEPPEEVAATGHDRCIVPLKPGNAQAWLAPETVERSTLYSLLDDRSRPYYEHRLAA